MAGGLVTLVLVSHSRALADGVAELAGQMAPDVTLLAAGGTAEGGLGTGFDRVLAALEEAVSGGGSAVVLTDLGSAVLTTESALEVLDPDDAGRVRLADAPFVEGAVEAAVTAQGGADVDAVRAAAERAGARFAAAGPGPSGPGDAEPGAPSPALGGRERADGPAADPAVVAGGATPAEATGGGSDDAPRPISGGAAEPTVRGTAVLRNRLGLHARPAGALARTASAFQSSIAVNGADARSVLALVALGAVGGTEVVVTATGPDARTAVNAIVAELEEGFGEA